MLITDLMVLNKSHNKRYWIIIYELLAKVTPRGYTTTQAIDIIPCYPPFPYDKTEATTNTLLL